jgi:glucose-1-phosphate thymidylyltransferase
MTPAAMRAVVLARGLGTRMQSVDAGAALTKAQKRAADAGLKAMMPIAGRPFLDFVLSAIADAGVRQVGIVVAPDHQTLREHYEAIAPPTRLGLELIVQTHPLGTADAVLAAERWCGNEPFLVMNGDNLYPAAVLKDVAALEEPGLAGFDPDDLVRSSNIEPARVGAFALVETDASGCLTRVVEKPSAEEMCRPPGRQARVSMNCWRFDPRIFDACREVPRSPRGELELPAAVNLAVSRGMPFRVVPARGPVLDLSRRADAAELSRRLSGLIPRP